VQTDPITSRYRYSHILIHFL